MVVRDEHLIQSAESEVKQTNTAKGEAAQCKGARGGARRPFGDLIIFLKRSMSDFTSVHLINHEALLRNVFYKLQIQILLIWFKNPESVEFDSMKVSMIQLNQTNVCKTV